VAHHGAIPFLADLFEFAARGLGYDPADVETIRAAYVASVADDVFGLGSRRAGDQIRAAYPVAILAGRWLPARRQAPARPAAGPAR